MKNKWVNFGLVICLTIFGFLLAEVLTRYISPSNYMKPVRPKPKNVWRELLHQPSEVPGLAYELAPNKQKVSTGPGNQWRAVVVTNSAGMRDSPLLDPKPGQTLINFVVLGDSFTFGFGVENEATYANVLERILNQSNAEKDIIYQVLNMGVGGYSTRDESLVLEHKVQAYAPKLVIVGYVLNDPEIDPIQPLHRYYHEPRWWQQVNLFRMIAKLKLDYDIKRIGNGNYKHFLHNTDRKWNSVRESFARMSKKAAEIDAKILLVIFPAIPRRGWNKYPYHSIHKKVETEGKTNRFAVLNLYETFRKHPPSELRLSDLDAHPSRLGHRITAEAIYRYLVDSKFIASH